MGNGLIYLDAVAADANVAAMTLWWRIFTLLFSLSLPLRAIRGLSAHGYVRIGERPGDRFGWAVRMSV